MYGFHWGLFRFPNFCYHFSRCFKIKICIFYLLCYSSGPIFGAGADLLISSNCNSNMDSYSNLPHTYDGEAASPSILMGDYNFTVADYEVFTPFNTSSKIAKNERYQ